VATPKAKGIELMLCGWRKSHTTGMVVSFLVTPEDESYFEDATAKKGKIAGQRYMAAFVEIGPDEQPVPEEKPKAHGHFPEGLCGLAVKWCADDHFQAWVCDAFPDLAQKYADGSQKGPEDQAKYIVCNVCRISSRKDLDTNTAAKEAFVKHIKDPYSAQREEDGVDAVPF